MSGAAWALAVATALGSITALTACSLIGTSKPPAQVTSTPAAPGAHRIAQLGFDRSARYASCLEPACPKATPKTLAPQHTAVARTAPTGTEASMHAASVATAPAIPVSVTPTPPSPAPAARTLILHFASQSAVLTQAHKALLHESLADLQHTDRIVIAGRTDDLGSESLNQSLAFARALAIRDHLLDLAPELPARIVIDAKGRCCYAAGNDTASGRAQNRRVELSFAPHAKGTP